MAGEFKLSLRQWVTGLLLSAVAAPVVVSLPISTLWFAADPALLWKSLPGLLVFGALSALSFAGAPYALLFGEDAGAPSIAAALLAIGAATGVAVAAWCLRLLRRRTG